MGERMGRVSSIIFALAAIGLFSVLTMSLPATAATCTVHGIVTDADGSPVPGADVTLFDGDRTELSSVKTNAAGSFTFSNVYVATDLCTVRVFYNDLHKTYNNAAYFDVWYQARGDVAIPAKDTQLGTYHRTTTVSTSTSGSPLSTPAPTIIISLLALFAVAIITKKH